MRRYSLVCDDSQAQEINALARTYGLTESEVLEQLVDVGLQQVSGDGDLPPTLQG